MQKSCETVWECVIKSEMRRLSLTTGLDWALSSRTISHTFSASIIRRTDFSHAFFAHISRTHVSCTHYLLILFARISKYLYFTWALLTGSCKSQYDTYLWLMYTVITNDKVYEVISYPFFARVCFVWKKTSFNIYLSIYSSDIRWENKVILDDFFHRATLEET